MPRISTPPQWQVEGQRALAAILLASTLGGCGHVVRADLMTHRATDFDFRSFSCETPAPKETRTGLSTSPRSGLQVRFLGVSGLHLEWQGVSLLTAPYFSRAGLWRVAFGRGSWDRGRIADGMRDVAGGSVVAILAAHSHHDHLFDLPVVARDFAPLARLYLNATGARMLGPYPDLVARTEILDTSGSDWVRLVDGAGRELPVRVLAIASPHARQAPGVHWAEGRLDEPWSKPWQETRLRKFQSGKPMALVIDLMGESPTEPLFRIYYQDAATLREGLSPLRDLPALGGRPVDLAILCIAGHHLAAEFPERLLADLRPRHVLVTHYEDFFRRPDRPLRFVPLLTDRRANRFLEKLTTAANAQDREPLSPTSVPCGPATAAWTMPVPGERLHFDSPQRQ